MALGSETDSELELHDAYSRAVMGVAERIGPSVVSLRIKQHRRAQHEAEPQQAPLAQELVDAESITPSFASVRSMRSGGGG